MLVSFSQTLISAIFSLICFSSFLPCSNSDFNFACDCSICSPNSSDEISVCSILISKNCPALNEQCFSAISSYETAIEKSSTLFFSLNVEMMCSCSCLLSTVFLILAFFNFLAQSRSVDQNDVAYIGSVDKQDRYIGSSRREDIAGHRDHAAEHFVVDEMFANLL